MPLMTPLRNANWDEDPPPMNGKWQTAAKPPHQSGSRRFRPTRTGWGNRQRLRPGAQRVENRVSHDHALQADPLAVEFFQQILFICADHDRTAASLQYSRRPKTVGGGEGHASLRPWW